MTKNGSDAAIVGQIKSQERTPNEFIEGFSARYMRFLDCVGFPANLRYTHGSALCGVSVNTFKRWCLLDVAPRTFSKFEENVTLVLNYTATAAHYNPRDIMLWLYFGKERDYPFAFDHNDASESQAEQNAETFALWACLYHYSTSKLGTNINFLPPSRREALLHAVRSVASEKHGIKLTSENFSLLFSIETMIHFRTTINNTVLSAMAN